MELNALYAALMGLSAHRELAGETGEPEVRVMEHAERLLFFLFDLFQRHTAVDAVEVCFPHLSAAFLANSGHYKFLPFSIVNHILIVWLTLFLSPFTIPLTRMYPNPLRKKVFS